MHASRFAADNGFSIQPKRVRRYQTRVQRCGAGLPGLSTGANVHASSELPPPGLRGGCGAAPVAPGVPLRSSAVVLWYVVAL